MNSFIRRPLAFGLLYLAIVSCSTTDSVPPSEPGQARVAANQLSIACDLNQGYRFNKDQHTTFGYLIALNFKDHNPIAPDIKAIATGIFNQQVVGVLSSANWSMLPNDNIVLKGRITAANAQTIKMITMLSMTRISVALSFVIYQYDPVSKAYFTQFKSYKGTFPPSVTKLATSSDQIYAFTSKNTELGIKIGDKAEKDLVGNYTFELTLTPPIATSSQQILLQTSPNAKHILPWGLPQF
ncbi:hypothetical protein GCM10028805_07040 [Spirosoma harenae]